MRTYDLDITGATRLSLPTNRAQDLVISTGPRGFQDLSGFLPLTDAQADQLCQTAGLRARLSDGGGTLWEGRVEDLTLRNGGVEIGALGDSRALDDTRYTALWSDSSVAGWEALTERDSSLVQPDRFGYDTNNRLYISPKQGTTHGNSPQIAGLIGYQIPSQSARQIKFVSFNYGLTIAPSWFASLSTADASWNITANIWTLTGSGAAQTGSWSGAVAATDRIVLRLYYDGANATYTGADGSIYLNLSDLRVETTSAASLYADEIVKALRDYVNTVNAGALSTSNRLIVSPGIDLVQEIYEDMRPSEILDRLAAYGDSSGNPYEWGIFEGRELYFRPRGTGGRAWAMDVADLEVTQRLDGLINSTYATYQDASDRTLRTAAQTNAASITRYGITRQDRVDVDTTSAATAALVAATSTAATATPVPTAKVSVRRFSTLTGAPARGEWVRAGDTVTIRNLPPTTNTAVDRVRTFRVAQTKYSLDDDTVEIVPEQPGPDLEFQIAYVLRQARA